MNVRSRVFLTVLLGGVLGCSDDAGTAGSVTQGDSAPGGTTMTGGATSGGTATSSASASGSGTGGEGTQTDDDTGSEETGSPGCAPRCDGETSVLCSEEGEEVTYDCAQLDLPCEPETGRCAGACAPHELSPFEGCNFAAVTTKQDSGGPMGLALVAVSETAQVEVRRDGSLVEQVSAVADAVRWIELERLGALNASDASVQVVEGAYTITATAPIRVVQYVPASSIESSDTSALLARHAWGLEHRAASYPDWGYQPGFLSITAAIDNTTVNIEGVGSSTIEPGLDLQDDGSGQLILDAGDVVQLITDANGDLTGVGVLADQPVMVIGGHGCTAVGYAYCDHLEEVMPPKSLLGEQYVVGLTPASDGTPGETVLRVVAFEAGTEVNVTGGSESSFGLAQPGAYGELFLTADVAAIEASAPVLVGEYLLSDRKPSLAVARPLPWSAAAVRFGVPNDGVTHFVQVVSTTDADVRLDGQSVSPVGSGLGYDLFLVEAAAGAHALEADKPLSAAVASYRSYASTLTRL